MPKIDIKSLKKGDEEKINFIHDDAIGYMKEIDDKIKTIGARSTWLIGILIGILIALASSIAFGLNATGDESDIIRIINATNKIAFILYLMFVAIYTYKLIVQKHGSSAHNNPEELLEKDIFKKDIKTIKFIVIKKLIKKIKINNEKLRKLTNSFNRFAISFIITLPYSLIWAIYLVFFS